MRNEFISCLIILVAVGLQPLAFAAVEREAVPFRVAAPVPDAAEVLSPAAIHLDGWLGQRILVNAKNRLLKVDAEPLLAGIRQKPGSHPWIGEHVGKWMHAATLAWAYTGDPCTLRLGSSIHAVAVGVLGKPTSGDNPKQAFSSCGELQAFAD